MIALLLLLLILVFLFAGLGHMHNAALRQQRIVEELQRPRLEAEARTRAEIRGQKKAEARRDDRRWQAGQGLG
jgi:hypothetical protein